MTEEKPQKLTKVQIKKLYRIWRDNIQFFVEDLMQHYLSNKIPPFHGEIYKLITTEGRLLLEAPRGFAKSMLCSVFYPLHSALFDNKKDICIISASEGLSIEWLRRIRTELETNPGILKYFGDLRSAKWTENHIILNNKNRTSIRARGAGGQIRGFRPDLLILDDIETEDSVASAEQRNKLREWIFKACLNTLLPEGQFIWIGTPISPLALIEEIYDKDNEWIKRRYLAYADGVQSEGHELWADLWTHSRLQQRKREIGSMAFASEYMCSPMSAEHAPIKPSHIRYFEEPPEQYSCVIAVDPAYSEEENADYKVASCVASDNRNNRYLLEYIRTHNPSGEFIDSFLNMYLKYQSENRILALGVPNSGTEKEFFNSVVKRVTERQLPISIVPLKNTFQRGGSKVFHRKKERIIAALQPLFEQGRYYVKNNQYEVVDELLAIGASRHDDVVDTLCYAEQLIQPGMFVEEGTKRDRYGEVITIQTGFAKNYGVE